MSIFGNLTNEGLEESQDRLGGFQPRDTDAYTGKIKAFYAGKALNSNAQSVTLIFEDKSGEYRETLWVTDKDGKNYYMGGDNKDKKIALPGYLIADEICMVTTEKPLSAQVAEEKIMNIYDPEAKKELPKAVQMFTELLGKDVILGINNVLENKSEKQNDGSYKPSSETRVINTIAKVFHYPTGLTVPEARDGVEPEQASFMKKWVERNKGKQQDRRKLKDGGNAGNSGRPGSAPQAGNQGAKTSSLFGK